MTLAAGRLGWSIQKLSDQLIHWQRTVRPTNQYAAAANRDLILSCTNAALSVCEQFLLPKCSMTFLEGVKEIIRRDEVPSFGIEAICAAWLKAPDHDYASWEEKTINQMMPELIQ
jgi:hypothetical protein